MLLVCRFIMGDRIRRVFLQAPKEAANLFEGDRDSSRDSTSPFLIDIISLL